jgi:hypothetical protein
MTDQTLKDAAREWVRAGMPSEGQKDPDLWYSAKSQSNYLVNDLATTYFDWCGCAPEGEMAEYLLATLEEVERRSNRPKGESLGEDAYSNGPFPDAATLTEGSRYLLWCWIDAQGWIEHGIAIRGSWLTEEAREIAMPLLRWIIKHEKEEQARWEAQNA